MLRRPAAEPREPSSVGRILFLHPGYPAPHHKLFSLPRVDPSPGDAGTVGVHHRTALLAAQIIADNAFSAGYLSVDREGRTRVDDIVPKDGILTEPEYYLVVANYDQANPYPVVPSWEDWQFPYDNFPSGENDGNDVWPGSSPVIDPLPSRCAVTTSSLGPTRAHLIPKLEEKWLRRNGMDPITNINDPGNLLTLRADLHKEFDNRQWTIVPKPGLATSAALPGQDPTFEYAVHVIGSAPSSSELRELYHNVTLQYCRHIPRECVLAHFAWSILYLIKPFLLCSVSRVVRVLVLDERDRDAPARYEVKKLTPDELDNRYGGGGSRSASPRKRSRAAEQQGTDSCSASRKRRREDDNNLSSGSWLDVDGPFDNLSSSCGDESDENPDTPDTQWHWLDHVGDDEYEEAVRAGVAERRGRSRTQRPPKRACLLPVGGQQAPGDCDHHDQPPLATSFSTVSTPGRESTAGSDQPACLPIIDADSGSTSTAPKPGHLESPTISDCAEHYVRDDAAAS